LVVRQEVWQKKVYFCGNLIDKIWKI